MYEEYESKILDLVKQRNQFEGKNIIEWRNFNIRCHMVAIIGIQVLSETI